MPEGTLLALFDREMDRIDRRMVRLAAQRTCLAEARAILRGEEGATVCPRPVATPPVVLTTSDRREASDESGATFQPAPKEDGQATRASIATRGKRIRIHAGDARESATRDRGEKRERES